MTDRLPLSLLLILSVCVHTTTLAATGDRSRSIQLRITQPSQTAVSTSSSARMSDSSSTSQPQQQASPPSVDVLDNKVIAGRAPRQRNPQLSADHLVLVGVDSLGNEIARVSILDPSLIRAESADQQGRITSTRLYRDSVDFSVVLPDDPRITSIKIYRPRWTGSQFLLDPVGEGSLQ